MPGSWFEILESARILSGQNAGKFTAMELKEAAGLAVPKDAAAWLAKFLKWGYVSKVGTEPGAGKKPRFVYALTEYGQSVAPKTSHRERLDELLQTIEAFLENQGKPAEKQTWKNLVKLAGTLREGLTAEDEARAKGRA